jgi:hypothetical protein
MIPKKFKTKTAAIEALKKDIEEFRKKSCPAFGNTCFGEGYHSFGVTTIFKHYESFCYKNPCWCDSPIVTGRIIHEGE